MMHDVHVFGDSHWRVFFPFVNHGSPGVIHVENNIRTIDMVANELSGATMYGLLNDSSKNGARRRILHTLDDLGGVDNVALVFGEVDVRYHNRRYFKPNGDLNATELLRLMLRYKQFIEHDLFDTDRVKENVFVYYGFAYPQRERTLLQPGVPLGDRMPEVTSLHEEIAGMLPTVLQFGTGRQRVHTIINQHRNTGLMVSDDGVHLKPEAVHPLVISTMDTVLR